MKETFRSTNFGPDALALIETCNAIVNEYMAAGLRLTLRQLYYQLVSKAIIPNTERSYKNVGNLISKARLSGLIDWSAIEDRVRVPRVPMEFTNLADLIEAAVHSYRLPRWDGQENYVELWVEKDALAGVLAPLAREFHITLMVNRGYSSQSAMYESADRFRIAGNAGRNLYLLYLGDLDPSGEDMVRDVGDRLEMFGVSCLTVHKLALTMEQVKRYKPPPNPAKMTDSRAAAFVAAHGSSSWEVDALPPKVLAATVRKGVSKLIDGDRMAAIVKREESDITHLQGFVKGVK